MSGALVSPSHGPVNRYPAGLGGLADLQNMASAPHGIHPDIFGAIDFTELYVNAVLRQIPGAVNVNVAAGPVFGTTYNLLGPDGNPWGPAAGEVWYVRQMSISKSVVNTAGTSEYAPISRMTFGGGDSNIGEYTIDSATRVGRANAFSFWLMPGQNVGLHLAAHTDTVARAYSATGTYAPLRF